VVGYAVAACTLGAVGSAMAPTLGWLTVARVCHGAAAAGIIPLSMAWVGDHVPWAQRQAVLAKLMGFTVLGMITGQWLSGVFADTVGWRLGFCVLALGGAATACGLRWCAPSALLHGPADPAVMKMGAWARMSAVCQLASARQVLVITAVEGGFAFSAMAFAPTHLHHRLGLAVSMAGAVMVNYGLGGLLYSRTVHLILRYLSPLTMARTGGLMAGACWLLLAWVPHWIWAAMLCLLAGLGFYMLHNTLQMRATQMAPAHRGTAVSLFASALFIGQSLGMLVAAWLVDRWSSSVVLASCGIGLALVGLSVMRLSGDPAPSVP